MSPLSDMLSAILTVIDLIANGISILVGIIVIYLLVEMNQLIGGLFRSALNYFIVGVCFDIVAIGWSIIFGHRALVAGSVHDLLMALGMLFITISVYKFALLVLPKKPQTQKGSQTSILN